MTEIVLIEGDGIGPEVVNAAKRCIEATEVDVTFTEAVMGQQAIEQYNTPLPDATVQAVQDAGVALKGPVTTPIGSGFRSVNVALRKRLALYANIRPCSHMPGVGSRVTGAEDIDLVLFRENLEDVYAGIEFEQGTETAEVFRKFLIENRHETPTDAGYSIKPISRTGSERIIRHAFEYAAAHGREKVTVVDKANIMKHTDGLFMQVGEQVAEEYGIEHEHVLVDNMAQQLVMRPEAYDVIVTQNLYGDILSDLGAGLVGGVGMIPSANIGEDAAVFASVHGTAPDIAGEGKANPTALIRSAAMLLEHVGEDAAAERLEQAVSTVIAGQEETVLTPDLGGNGSTDTLTNAVIDAV